MFLCFLWIDFQSPMLSFPGSSESDHVGFLLVGFCSAARQSFGNHSTIHTHLHIVSNQTLCKQSSFIEQGHAHAQPFPSRYLIKQRPKTTSKKHKQFPIKCSGGIHSSNRGSQPVHQPFVPSSSPQYFSFSSSEKEKKRKNGNWYHTYTHTTPTFPLLFDQNFE